MSGLMRLPGRLTSTINAGPSAVAGGLRVKVALPLTVVFWALTKVAVTVTAAGAG